jgi:hypothetical protein
MRGGPLRNSTNQNPMRRFDCDFLASSSAISCLIASNTTPKLLVVLDLHRLDLAGQVSIGFHQPPQLDESPPDGDVDFDRTR